MKSYNITTNGLTTLPGKWLLVAIVINSKGASSNTATIYDDIEGQETVERRIAKIDTTDSVTRLDFGLPIQYGINIRTATGTAPNLTVIYKEEPTLYN